MTAEEASDEVQGLTRETQRIWDQKAEFWDAQMGEGNQHHRVLIGPAAERLLAVQPDELVLDVACGNGVFARRLAELGARVVATDFSQRFLERAAARTVEHRDRIEYRLIDATSEDQLMSLGERRFDAAVCNMALMDMTTIQPLFKALSRLLKERARFVFSVPHPCFNLSGGKMVVEQEDRDGELVTVYAMKVSNYLQPTQERGMGMVGEPEPHYYFHRPLHELFSACFQAGFALDGLEEPAFGEEHRNERPFSWANFSGIPPVMVARMRLPG